MTADITCGRNLSAPLAQQVGLMGSLRRLAKRRHLGPVPACQRAAPDLDEEAAGRRRERTASEVVTPVTERDALVPAL